MQITVPPVSEDNKEILTEKELRDYGNRPETFAK